MTRNLSLSLDDFDYNELDPGIRRTVKWLHGLGYDTTDSGDGRSKFARDGECMDCALPYPNVAIKVPSSAMLVYETQVIVNILKEYNVPMTEIGMDDHGPVWIQASYDPANNHADILIANLDDEKLLKHGVIKRKVPKAGLPKAKKKVKSRLVKSKPNKKTKKK